MLQGLAQVTVKTCHSLVWSHLLAVQWFAQEKKDFSSPFRNNPRRSPLRDSKASHCACAFGVAFSPLFFGNRPNTPTPFVVPT